MEKTNLEKKIEADKLEQAEAAEIERKHNEWTKEQAQKCIGALVAKNEAGIYQSNPAEEFETIYRAPITESVLNQISVEATELNKELQENYKERIKLNTMIKELEKKQDQILEDIRTMTHGFSVMAHWEFDFDNEVKRLVTTFAGDRVVIQATDMSSVDKQLRLGDERLPQPKPDTDHIEDNIE